VRERLHHGGVSNRAIRPRGRLQNDHHTTIKFYFLASHEHVLVRNIISLTHDTKRRHILCIVLVSYFGGTGFNVSFNDGHIVAGKVS
jgi:hypothetical protein